jgi:hypothetical protein
MKPIVIIGIALVVVLIPVAVYGYMWLIPITGNAIANMDPMYVKCQELIELSERTSNQYNQFSKEIENKDYEYNLQRIQNDIDTLKTLTENQEKVMGMLWQYCMTDQEKQSVIRDNPDFDYSKFED